ncbi:hypothetical protein DFR55_1117 [Herbinix hemicellulosilytica]|uniref:Putative membrane protein n=1 Tax=Herbinix hemicellulosilytica TaxID=1564487 RepID=A0A0H5SJ19_HERHM|nr:DUF6106 family protein [Herbinix hemicellulosilytica]RBP58470.1 hypothetical protein DFR55_1117 [Herbinix hemicellulosilytica]CRZ35065.1 putative membrane protein [Herbinix hemicellulosilytica]
MNELYAEAVVKRKDTFATIGLRVLMIIGSLAGFFLIVAGNMLSFLGIAILVAVFYFYPKLSVEYEYVFVDGQLDFDKISGKSRRKTMLRIDFEQVEIMAPYNSAALDNYKHLQLETKDFSSLNKDSKPYVIIANADGKKLKILFEPSEKMLAMIKQKSPRKVSNY